MEGGCDCTESLRGEFRGDTVVLRLGRGGGGGGYTCGKMAESYKHTTFQGQFPGFDIVL